MLDIVTKFNVINHKNTLFYKIIPYLPISTKVNTTPLKWKFKNFLGEMDVEKNLGRKAYILQLIINLFLKELCKEPHVSIVLLIHIQKKLCKFINNYNSDLE